MIANADIQYIDTPDALRQFSEQLSGSDWIALDTEFLREKTYYPKLCLLQIATPEVVACIDPLALGELSPILDVIFDTRITKVMHAARQDLEIFYHIQGSVPAPVFDTQIAALLLGHPDQIGYGNLVREVLGVSLEKKHTRADWSLRPLSRDQVQYAADDVVYLVDVYQQLLEKLDRLGRLDWLNGDFERLASADLYHNAPDRAWLRVKGANRLKGASLSILQALAEWRETVAQQKDIPRGWLLRDDVLVDLARHSPDSMSSLGKIRGLGERLLKRNGEHLLGLVEDAKKKQPEPFPARDIRKRLSPSQDALVDVMMAVVRISAENNSLNPAVLATRKHLEKLVTGDTNSELMQGWRKKLVGDQLQALLNGEIGLSVKDGELVLQA
ncbi:MAG: ribonuclease D [Gammaproteobacteria bacterium]|nr:ribonuclease D [Gammaproteobacteria bacterium]